MNLSRYWVGITFLILSMCVSCANDVICKFMGERLNALEIIFFRFFFGLITLLPFILKHGTAVLHTRQLGINILRGVLGAASLFLCTYSVIKLPLVEVTTILWIIPLFQLVLTFFWLSEKISLPRWIATIIGFLGLLFVTVHDSNAHISLNYLYIFPISAAFLFAVQDVMIKKVIATESRTTMLFYFAIVSSIVSFFPMLFVWIKPTARELFLLFLLGIGGNLIQYFIFKAFHAVDISALSPYRYIEFLLSAIFAFVFFGEIPGINVLIGAAILVPCTLYLAYSEQGNKLKSNKKSTLPPT